MPLRSARTYGVVTVPPFTTVAQSRYDLSAGRHEPSEEAFQPGASVALH
ncbi:hypothetical protein [Catenulispora rubra]|nr:hypothetical protein [Catenulispora rubra]